MTDDALPVAAVPVPAHDVPIPRSVSREAQAALAAAALQPGNPYPPSDDPQAWRDMIARSDAGLLQWLSSQTGLAESVDSEPVDMDGVAAFRQQARGAAHGDKLVLDIHGGGLIMGGGELCRWMGMAVAANLGALTYSVDYRMPPDHPYPAALDDCIRAYRYLLDRHSAADIVVWGASAGGNLAAALALRARDEGLPAPAAVMLVTPELDLTESGDSFQTNRYADVVLTKSLMPANRLYAAGHDLAHPYLSPLFGDFTGGFPPTMLTAGTRDLFLSNAVRMHNALRRAGNRSELYIEEAMPHAGFRGAPEDRMLAADQRDFAERAWRGELG